MADRAVLRAERDRPKEKPIRFGEQHMSCPNGNNVREAMEANPLDT